MLADVDAVVVHERFGFVDAVRNLAHRRAGEALALVEDQLDTFLEHLRAVALEQVRETPLPGSDRSDLRPKVTHRKLRQATVAANDRGDFLILLAAFENLYERHLQAFGKNVPCDRAKHAADVLPMAHRRREGDQLAIVEDRQSENHVIQVAAHHLRIVGEENIARLDVLLAPVAKLRLDRIRQAADEHRQPEPDGNGVAVGVEKADGEILGLIDDHVIGRAHEIGLHLIGDRHHRAANHFRGEGVYPRYARNLKWHISNLTPFLPAVEHQLEVKDDNFYLSLCLPSLVTRLFI